MPGADNDGIVDSVDNCPCIFNPLEHDVDSDGLGNEYDPLFGPPPPPIPDSDGDNVPILNSLHRL